MNRLFVGMDVHKEKIVVVGLPGEGSHPVLRDGFGGGNLSRLVKRMQTFSRTWQVEACYEAGPSGYVSAAIRSRNQFERKLRYVLGLPGDVIPRA